jgi:hypothetical protein
VLSPDERRIAASRVDPGKQSAIWVRRDARHRLKVSFDPVSIEPIWSPDSASSCSGSARDGPPSLIQKTVTGEPQDVVLLKSDRECPRGLVRRAFARAQERASAGRQPEAIVFRRVARTRRYLEAAADRRSQTDPLLQTPSSETDARCSPDGRWLAYT